MTKFGGAVSKITLGVRATASLNLQVWLCLSMLALGHPSSLSYSKLTGHAGPPQRSLHDRPLFSVEFDTGERSPIRRCLGHCAQLPQSRTDCCSSGLWHGEACSGGFYGAQFSFRAGRECVGFRRHVSPREDRGHCLDLQISLLFPLPFRRPSHL